MLTTYFLGFLKFWFDSCLEDLEELAYAKNKIQF